MRFLLHGSPSYNKAICFSSNPTNREKLWMLNFSTTSQVRRETSDFLIRGEQTGFLGAKQQIQHSRSEFQLLLHNKLSRGRLLLGNNQKLWISPLVHQTKRKKTAKNPRPVYYSPDDRPRSHDFGGG